MITMHNDLSIALFGSRARGDADSLSDADLLVVSDILIDREVNSYAAAGYSVSSFTWPQLAAMSTDGSLFLQHLKQESIILQDPKDRLASVLSDFRPSLDQSKKLRENLGLFQLTRGTPPEPETVGWAFDVLAVAVRNHAVLLAAEEQRFIFSFNELTRWTAAKFDLTREEEALFLELRSLKRMYRSSGPKLEFDYAQLLATQRLVDRIFGANCVGAPLDLLEFARIRLDVDPSMLHWYRVLRSYEAATRALIPLLPQHMREFLKNVEQPVQKPSPYSIAECGGLSAIRASLGQALDWVRLHEADVLLGRAAWVGSAKSTGLIDAA